MRRAAAIQANRIYADLEATADELIALGRSTGEQLRVRRGGEARGGAVEYVLRDELLRRLWFTTDATSTLRSTVARPPIALPTAPLLDVSLTLGDYPVLVDWMESVIARGEQRTMTNGTTHLLITAGEDERVRRATAQIDVIVPDAQPVVWALRALNEYMAHRAFSSELLARFCERAAITGARIFLYGGRNQGVLVMLALELRQRYPGLNIVGGYSPPYRGLSEAETEWVATEIMRARPDVVFCALSQPGQELWLTDMRKRVDTPLLAGVGPAFDYLSGLISPPPEWVSLSGLGWVYRMAQEPRRLWRRYAHDGPVAVQRLTKQIIDRKRKQ